MMQTLNKNRNPYLTNWELLTSLQHSNSANLAKKRSKKYWWTPQKNKKTITKINVFQSTRNIS
jgi:hypothetical protein